MSDRLRLGSLALEPDLDRWVALEPDGTVVVRTGKAELGQGIRTALTAVAADELGVDPARIRVEGPATGTAPNELITAGSGSIEQSVMALRQACAHARHILLARAAERLGAPVQELSVDDGTVRAPDGASASYAELGAEPFDHRVTEPIETVPISARRWSGHGLPRVDLTAKIRGEPVFVHDLRLPGLRHARVLRPPRPGARLTTADAELRDLAAALGPPERARTGVDDSDVDDRGARGSDGEPAGGVDVVRDGSVVAVVADREGDAVVAAEALARSLTWEGGGIDPALADPATLEARVTSSTAIVDGAAVEDRPAPPLEHTGAAQVVRARYSKPLLLHGSIGPSAAVAHLDGDELTVWTHSQGVELLRPSLAEVLGLPAERVRVVHVDGAGCYGHNGADDVALDAALVAVARPGRPVAVQWSRDDEHGWEPAAPAMAVDLEAGLDEQGCITSWQHDVYSQPHGARPRPHGEGTRTSGLLASWYREQPFEQPAPWPVRGFHSGGHRNADPYYDLPVRRVVHHQVPAPVRTSSTRSLGAFANVFAIESFVDELALAAGSDPVAFRLAHLGDRRAREVIEAAVDLAGGLVAPGGLDAPGRGLAFARYENVKAYVAVVAEVEVVARTGEVRLRRAWIAADAGEVIDPDGLANQLEGGVVQAASWTLKEQLELGPDGVRNRDWESYPILRFSEAPLLETRLLDRPSERPLGAGEASTGPTAAAIANAVHQATGARIRDLPLRPDRVRRALTDLL